MRYLFLLVLGNNLFSAYTQEIPFTHYSNLNGLPSSETYAILEDHNGYIWIGTDRGLTLFDGNEFTVFSEKDGLKENVFFDIYESADHVLWLLGYHKIYYSRDHKTFHDYPFNAIVEDFYEKQTAFFNILTYSHDSLHLRTHRGIILSIASGGGYRFTDKRKDYETNYDILRKEQTLPEPHFDNYAQLSAYYEQRATKYLYSRYPDATTDSLKRISLICNDYHTFKTNSFLSFSPQIKDSTTQHFLAPGGYIEVRHFKNIKNNKAYYIPFTSTQKILLSSLNGMHILDYLIDRENGVWIITNKNGLFYFENIHLKKIALEGNITHVFENENKQLVIHRGPKDENLVYASTLADGQLQFSTANDSNVRITTHQQPLRFTSNGDFFSQSSWKGFRTVQIKGDNIYFCGGDYIARADTIIDKYYTRLHRMHPERVMSFYLENESDIWVGGLKGLYHFNGEKAQKKSFKNGTINHRVEDLKKSETTGHYFIATIGNGLYVTSDDSILYHFRETNSTLAHNSINQLYLDGDSLLWVATNKGINILDLSTEPYELIPPCVLGQSVSKKIHQIIADERYVYFLTSNGLFQFDKGHYTTITSKSVPLIFEAIKTNGKKIPLTQTFDFEHDENHIDIQFNTPAFGDILDALIFEYRFVGEGVGWKKTKHRELTFINLPPNWYQLEIRAMCFNREISARRLLITFNIRPPFWKTYWFILLALISLLIGGVFIIRFFFRRQQRQSQAQQERIELKQKALRAQLNSHFIFNTLSAIQHSISVNPIPETKKQIENFASLLRTVLEESDYALYPLRKEIALIQKYIVVENFRFQKNVTLTVDCEDDTILESLIPPLLLQPLIENTIQHGFLLKPQHEKNEITIHLFTTGEYLCIEITDNGIGLFKAREHKKNSLLKRESKGLKLVKQRLESLYAISKPVSGYLLTITI